MLPERLCLYHAGTGKITFLACLRLTTLFIFIFFGFVVAPAYYEKEGISPNFVRSTSFVFLSSLSSYPFYLPALRRSCFARSIIPTRKLRS